MGQRAQERNSQYRKTVSLAALYLSTTDSNSVLTAGQPITFAFHKAIQTNTS